MTDVAIVGIGMHEFGRHEGVSGMEQGAIAVRRALSDAGIKWDDVEFAYGGSAAAGSPDHMVKMLGLTGLQFINCLLYTSPSPRDRQKSRMPSSA